MSERKLVSIRDIKSLTPIEGADFVEVAEVDGWKVVVRKGEFVQSDEAVYFEIDSALPLDRPEFAFLAERGSKTIGDKQYHILKTAKIRGEYSQGLLLSSKQGYERDADLSEEFGVFKYEPPLPAGSGAVGDFPSFYASKTDSERVQNLGDQFLKGLDPNNWYATEKIDGTSATFVKTPEGEFICAGRNWQVSNTESVQGAIAAKYDLESIMPNGSVIQGEIYGDGIQGNPLGVVGQHLAIFYHNSEPHEVAILEPFMDLVESLSAPEYVDLVLPATVEEALNQVEGIKSLINPDRNAEGVVWWKEGAEDNRENFKVISNNYLLDHDV